MNHRSFLALTALLSLALVSFPAAAWIRSPATTFATLPPGATTPEGITVGLDGSVYVSTFGFPDPPAVGGPGQVVVFDSHGNLLRDLVLTGPDAPTPHLLGLAFHPTTHALLVLDFGGGKVLNVNPVTGVESLFADIGTACGSFPSCTKGPGLNALTFDGSGNVYISDSFNGIIWRTDATGGSITLWVQDPLLATTGNPPFGANGIAFNNAGSVLFVANTGDDSVIEIPVAGGVAGTPAPFVYSINGADGLIVDQSDNIWVAANQSDEIVVVDPTGKVIAKLGDFGGIDNKGAAQGLLFPASLVFSGNFVLVTNLALDLGTVFGIPTVDSQWAAQVTRYTVSKINRGLPPIH
ncbi:MAG TPA: SMP-30/gluconolactonase/LRE family protein [Casimicrobiaceae bacterium]